MKFWNYLGLIYIPTFFNEISNRHILGKVDRINFTGAQTKGLKKSFHLKQFEKIKWFKFTLENKCFIFYYSKIDHVRRALYDYLQKFEFAFI